MGSILYIIGNGFDIHHGIKSRYADYRVWLRANINTLYQHLKKLYSPLNYIWWRDFEEHLADICIDKYVSYILNLSPKEQWSWFQGLEKEYGGSLQNPLLVNGPPNIGYSVSDLVSLITHDISLILSSLSDTFRSWINQLAFPDITKALNITSDEAFYITFNYTDTLETLYHIPSSRICHIHGSTNLWRDLVLGHGKSAEQIIESMNAAAIKYRKPSHKANRITNEVLSVIFSQLIMMKKDTESIIQKELSVVSQLDDIKSISVYGLSFSLVDQPYLDYIIERLKGRTIDWYVSLYKLDHPEESKEDRARIDLFFRRHHISNYYYVNLDQLSKDYNSRLL